MKSSKACLPLTHCPITGTKYAASFHLTPEERRAIVNAIEAERAAAHKPPAYPVAIDRACHAEVLRRAARSVTKTRGLYTGAAVHGLLGGSHTLFAYDAQGEIVRECSGLWASMRSIDRWCDDLGIPRPTYETPAQAIRRQAARDKQAK